MHREDVNLSLPSWKRLTWDCTDQNSYYHSYNKGQGGIPQERQGIDPVQSSPETHTHTRVFMSNGISPSLNNLLRQTFEFMSANCRILTHYIRLTESDIHMSVNSGRQADRHGRQTRAGRQAGTGRQTGRQADRHGRQTRAGRQAGRGRKTDIVVSGSGGQVDRHGQQRGSQTDTDRQAYRQTRTDRKTEKVRQTWTDRQSNRH